MTLAIVKVSTDQKSLLTAVSQTSAAVEAQRQAFLALSQDHADLKKRFVSVETRVLGAPAPPPMPKAIEPAATEANKFAMKFYARACFHCHQQGRTTLVTTSTVPKVPVILFTPKGERAPISAQWKVDLIGHLTPETGPPTMPPVKYQLKAGEKPPTDGSFKVAPPSNEEVSAAVVDVKTWPKKEEKKP
jgi:hypothetical protein